MNNINLAEMERVAKAATPGPWFWKPSEWDCDFEHDEDEHVKDCHPVAGAFITPFMLDCGEYHGLADNDAAHIAAVSPDVVLRLVALARDLRAASEAVLKSTEIWHAGAGPEDYSKEHAALRDALADHGIIDEAI